MLFSSDLSFHINANIESDIFDELLAIQSLAANESVSLSIGVICLNGFQFLNISSSV